MNRLTLTGDWKILKGKLKQGWARLTRNDAQYLRARDEELCGQMDKSIARVRRQSWATRPGPGSPPRRYPRCHG